MNFMSYLHNVNYIAPAEEGKPAQRLSKTVVGETVDEAADKLRKSVPGADVIQVMRLNHIDIP